MAEGDIKDEDQKLEQFVEIFGEEQVEVALLHEEITENPKLVLSLLAVEEADFSEVKPKVLRKVRDKINRELEDEEGLTMSEEEIMNTNVKNLTGVEAAKGIKMISEQVERDLQDD